VIGIDRLTLAMIKALEHNAKEMEECHLPVGEMDNDEPIDGWKAQRWEDGYERAAYLAWLDMENYGFIDGERNGVDDYVFVYILEPGEKLQIIQ
jgi:hypothetical protein